MHQDVKKLKNNNSFNNRKLTSYKIQNKTSLKKGGSFDKDRKIMINLLCTYSVEKPELYFCNKINHKSAKTPPISAIMTLIKNNGKPVSYDKIPFESDNEDYLKRNKKDRTRVEKILKIYGCNFNPNTILKFRQRKPKEIKQMKNLPYDELRIFFKKINNEKWDVVLIDPWHLVATEKYEEQYKEHQRNYIYGIEQLKIEQ